MQGRLEEKILLKVLGDGSAIRDFIHANDVARGMLNVIRKNYNKPINLGSGKKISIKDIAIEIQKNIKDLKIEDKIKEYR